LFSKFKRFITSHKVVARANLMTETFSLIYGKVFQNAFAQSFQNFLINITHKLQLSEFAYSWQTKTSVLFWNFVWLL